MTHGGKRERDTAGQRSLASHGAGFVTSGLIAFAVDAGVLFLLTHYAGLDPFSARVFAILTAMVAAWLLHRRLTFAVKTSPSIAEFVRFAVVAAGAALVNYAVYAAILLLWARMPPLAALVAATAVSMCVSYVGMRLGVFRHRA
ncbi:MAG: GtrA family protein [Hyphomicrobiaceae bacterium]|nr:GtrA family protein [Hyphomicrobiaceae bacterium]